MRIPEATELIDDCDAVLSGLFAEHLARRRRTIPAWAWLNLLAHGSGDQLQGAGEALAGYPVLRHWRDARAYLAHDVLETVGQTATTLRELQRDVLIPLELQMIGTDSGNRHTRPALISLVLTALASYRGARSATS